MTEPILWLSNHHDNLHTNLYEGIPFSEDIQKEAGIWVCRNYDLFDIMLFDEGSAFLV